MPISRGWPSSPSHVPNLYLPSLFGFGGELLESAIMALVPGDLRTTRSMNIIDLRQATVRQIEPLLHEEANHWRDELHWDYRGALELIKRFLDAHALSGCVALEDGSAVGYSFYVLEDHKGLIGGMYVTPKQEQGPIGRRLLEEMLFTMRALPANAAHRSPTDALRRSCGRRAARPGFSPAHPPIHAARSGEADRTRPRASIPVCASTAGTTVTSSLAPS